MYKNKPVWLNKNIASYLSYLVSRNYDEEKKEMADPKHCLIEILRTCHDDQFVTNMQYLQGTHLATNKIAFFLERIQDLRAKNKCIHEEVEYQKWINAGAYHRAHTITVYLLDQPYYMFTDELLKNLPTYAKLI